MARRKCEKPANKNGGKVTVRFTGAAGASIYTYDDGKRELRVGDQVAALVEPDGHWAALLASGNAEVVGE